MFKKKIASFLLVLAITSSVFYQPLTVPRAQALAGLGGIVIDVKRLIRAIVDGIAMNMAQKMIDNIVNETVKWAGTGFEGGPAYATDSRQFILGTADGVIGDFILGSELGALCSPFRNTIQLSLRHQYGQPSRDGSQFQCRLSDITGNVEEFFSGSFSRGGGWDTWFSVTQNPSNNPYDAYISAQIEMDSRLAGALSANREKLGWSEGFKDLAGCLAYNPSQEVIDAYERELYRGIPEGDLDSIGRQALDISRGLIPYNPSKDALACIKEGPVTVAGTTIKNQLDKVLPTGIQKLVTVTHIEQLIGAFASGLLNRYVFSQNPAQGIFASGSAYSFVRESLDVDGDGIPDGWDTDGILDANGRGTLNICHFGIKGDAPRNPVTGLPPAPSNDNCILSRDANTAPFFIPLCTATNETVGALKVYFYFVGTNVFETRKSDTWLNRTMSATGGVDALSRAFRQYGMDEYEDIIFLLDQYNKFLNYIISSLAQYEHLHPAARDFSGVNERARLHLIFTTGEIITFLERVQVAVNQRCENPDPVAINAVLPLPVITYPDTEFASCSASTSFASIGQLVVWSAVTTLEDASFTWSGEEINSMTGESINVNYQSPGEKTASIIVIGTTAEGRRQMIPAMCEGSVNVTSGPIGPGGPVEPL
jgi:hypothetical protein